MIGNGKALAMVAAVALIGVVSWQAWSRSGATASPAEYFGDAVAELSADDGTAVAVVNGVSIPQSKVRAFLVFHSAGVTLTPDNQPRSVQEYVEMLVETELMFQEAQRRGLVPSDEEVVAMARQQKQVLLDFLSQDTPEAHEARAWADQLKGTDYHPEVYDTRQVMLDGWRRTMAVGLLRGEIMKTLSPDVLADLEKREAAFKQYAAELRKAADVQVLVK